MSDNEGKTPLMYACENDRQGTDIVRLLLIRGVDQSVSDYNGTTPLMHACNLLHGFQVSYSRDRSVDLDWKCFHICTCVSMLIDRGANVDVCSSMGKTVLMHVCKYNWTRSVFTRIISNVLNLLLSKTANNSVQDDDGNTALMLACKIECTFVIKLLLDKGADQSIRDHDGRTALMIVKEEGRWKKNEIINICSQNYVPSIQYPVTIA